MFDSVRLALSSGSVSFYCGCARSFRSLFLVLLAATSIVGCGSSVKVYDVTGTVTLDGKPAADVAVMFHAVAGGLPAELRTVNAVTDSAGKFSLNAAAGEYRVALGTATPSAAPTPTGDPAVPATPDGGALVQAVPAPTPFRAYTLAATPLTAKVTEKDTKFDFAAKSK